MHSVKPQLTIHALGREDAPALAQLEAACFSTPWQAEQYDQFIASGMGQAQGPAPLAQALACCPNKAAAGFVAGAVTAHHELVGYISFVAQFAAGEIEIYNVAVAPAMRRAGTARQLLTAMLEAATGTGIAQFFLEVREHNLPALGLYYGAGFSLCGRRKAYYADTGEDALLLSLEKR
ncbi:GNAT family N-acetyltransferase [Desulfovibrio cuneatus]|uniref:GNAT family N-acetyltransferase n=1 Tax=Desulfovibrio cuneatus TaxID=159728 RepID=UPI0003F771AC|nr:GNAT family N-acetyltransferase [Desulfovibrio cuneatus]